MDLFSPQVPRERQHVYYRELISGRHDDKMRLLQTWADDFHDRDGKFAKEFQTTFDPCFWELYLFQAFRELGGSVDLSHTRPDFLVALPDGSRFCAEATIASHAEGYAPAAQPQFEHMPELDARLEYQSLRLANAVSSKLRKFRSDYAALAHVADKPFVLCIAPFDQQCVGEHLEPQKNEQPG